jgi:hypothetical protein
MVRVKGIRAAAEEIWYPCHRLGTVEAIKARLEEIQREARRGTLALTGSA